MSANGIQLNSEPQHSYFHPTLREYWQSLRNAVLSNNLPAANQALAQLGQANPSPNYQTQIDDGTDQVSLGLQNVGNALESGDLAGAQQAIGELQSSLQSLSDGSVRQQGSATTPAPGSGTNASPEVDTFPDTGLNLNVSI